MTFEELKVAPALIAALARQKIAVPTAIQAAALPLLAEGKDAYLRAETGTGKTLAYLLPLFARIVVEEAATQVVVLAPTHELAIQIHRACCDLATAAGLALRSVLLIGGTPLDRQVEKLKKKPHVVVGTPGRVVDLLRAGKLKVHLVKCLVLDEADRLLAAEGLPLIDAIVRALPRRRQTLFVSATETPEASATAAKIAPDHVVVATAAAPISAAIEHLYLVCEARDKPDLLRKLLHALEPERAIVFVHRNETAEEVAAKLEYHHIAVADLHGAFDKLDRKEAMDDFRRGKVRVLLASDVAARGLDIAGVSHVFNLDVPTLSKAYLHRVGRTARAGATGTAITLLGQTELRLIDRFARELGIELQAVRLREGRVVAAEEGPSGPSTSAHRSRRGDPS